MTKEPPPQSEIILYQTEDELEDAATYKDYLQVRFEGYREVARNLRHYRLDPYLPSASESAAFAARRSAIGRCRF